MLYKVNGTDCFLDTLDTCIARMEHNDILVIGADTNSSIGVSVPRENDRHLKSTGQFGMTHRNTAGERCSSYLSMGNMRAVTTFFKKKNYATSIICTILDQNFPTKLII